MKIRQFEVNDRSVLEQLLCTPYLSKLASIMISIKGSDQSIYGPV